MLITQVRFTNFRNLANASINLSAGKTALIGENAQGKSNFLEAVEFATIGRSHRAGKDTELITWGCHQLKLEVCFIRQNVEQSVSLELSQGLPEQRSRSVSKQIKVNGVSQSSTKGLLGHLVAVSFKSSDLNLLRGGPKFRRDWLDGVSLRIKPAYYDVLLNYGKVVTQRNRLLKDLSATGKVTVSFQDQLLAWDKQLARWGAQIIKQRLKLLSEMLPLAVKHQRHISGRRETLAANYLLPISDQAAESADDDSSLEPAFDKKAVSSVSVEQLEQSDEQDIALWLLGLLKEKRSEEFWRRQTLVGPHRDDIQFTLNDANAVSFASQGQQRSLVISLKLAELDRVAESLSEPPILLLDDVLAELDIMRQGFLMSAVGDDMQTILTTTHLSGFDPKWLEGAAILNVEAGQIALPSCLGNGD